MSLSSQIADIEDENKRLKEILGQVHALVLEATHPDYRGSSGDALSKIRQTFRNAAHAEPVEPVEPEVKWIQRVPPPLSKMEDSPMCPNLTDEQWRKRQQGYWSGWMRDYIYDHQCPKCGQGSLNWCSSATYPYEQSNSPHVARIKMAVPEIRKHLHDEWMRQKEQAHLLSQITEESD